MDLDSIVSDSNCNTNLLLLEELPIGPQLLVEGPCLKMLENHKNLGGIREDIMQGNQIRVINIRDDLPLMLHLRDLFVDYKVRLVDDLARVVFS